MNVRERLAVRYILTESAMNAARVLIVSKAAE